MSEILLDELQYEINDVDRKLSSLNLAPDMSDITHKIGTPANSSLSADHQNMEQNLQSVKQNIENSNTQLVTAVTSLVNATTNCQDIQTNFSQINENISSAQMQCSTAVTDSTNASTNANTILADSTLLNSTISNLQTLNNDMSTLCDQTDSKLSDLYQNIHEISSKMLEQQTLDDADVTDTCALTPYDFDDIDFSTLPGTTSTIVFERNYAYNSFVSFTIPVCYFRTSNKNVSVKFYIELYHTTPKYLRYYFKICASSYYVQNTYLINGYERNITNAKVDADNILEMSLNNFFQENKMSLKKIRVELTGQDLIIVDQPKKFKVERLGPNIYVTKIKNNTAYVSEQLTEKFCNKNLVFRPFCDDVVDIALCQKNDQNNNTLYPLCYAKTNQIYKMQYYDYDTHKVVKTNLDTLTAYSVDYSASNNVSESGKVFTATTFFGIRNKFILSSQICGNITSHTNYRMGQILLVNAVKQIYKFNRSLTAKLVITTLDGNNYFVPNINSNTPIELSLGFGTNVTAYYTDLTGNKIDVYMKVLDKMVKCQIEINNFIPTLVSKKVIGTYDAYYLLPNGYAYEKNGEFYYIANP